MINKWNWKRMFLLCVSIVIGIFLLYNFNRLHSFLAITKRVDTKTLVIEHWLFDYMIDQAAEEIKAGNYEYVLVIHIDDHADLDSLNACEEIQRLIDRGVDSSIVKMIKMPDLCMHYTFTSAITVKNWLKSQSIPDNDFNVYSGGPHARKTYIAFKRVFGKFYRIGIIASPIMHYNDRLWWYSRPGFIITMKNFIGYLYVRLWQLNNIPH